MELEGITEWYKLGTYLRIRKRKLDEIEQNFKPQGIYRCRAEVADAWLKGNPNASWEDLIYVLTLMEENALAAELKAKYVPQSASNQNGNQRADAATEAGGATGTRTVTALHTDITATRGTCMQGYCITIIKIIINVL